MSAGTVTAGSPANQPSRDRAPDTAPNTVAVDGPMSDVRRRSPLLDDWTHELLLERIKAVAAIRHLFTADDIHAEHFGDLTLNRGDVGNAFVAAHTTGLIRPVGFTTSRRTGRRGSIIRVWAAHEDGDAS